MLTNEFCDYYKNIFPLFIRYKQNFERKYQLEYWKKHGGVLIIGYDMFRTLTGTGKRMKKSMQTSFSQCLLDPGPDVIVCDEGHLLKNEDTALSKAMRRVKTLRRIVLTGTPLQNNLVECKFFFLFSFLYFIIEFLLFIDNIFFFFLFSVLIRKINDLIKH